METKLLPCPFCGAKVKQTYQDTDGTWGVQCYMCSVWLGEAHDTEAEAIEAWNTRHERTCRNISLKAHKGVFCCSECEIRVDIALMDSVDDYLPPFCPNCGARVVD